MAFHRTPTPTRQHLEAPVEPLCKLSGRHRGDPRRGKLDRQRHPIQTATHLPYCGRVLVVELKTSCDCRRALDEEARRFGRATVSGATYAGGAARDGIGTIRSPLRGPRDSSPTPRAPHTTAPTC
jgi:hypothetical protein